MSRWRLFGSPLLCRPEADRPSLAQLPASPQDICFAAHFLYRTRSSTSWRTGLAVLSAFSVKAKRLAPFLMAKRVTG